MAIDNQIILPIIKLESTTKAASVRTELAIVSILGIFSPDNKTCNCKPLKTIYPREIY